MHRLHTIALTAATLALVAGCSNPKPPPRMAAANTMASDATMPAMTAPQQRQDTRSPTSGSVHIDPRILKACGNIPEAHFAFDSVSIQPAAAASLDALARCFTTGPLAGRRMVLTGHADPRGEVEYNLGLGQRRAGSVSAYLGSRGVAHSQ